MADEVYLAIDLGASSGRVLAGLFDGESIRLEELHRFENGAVLAGGCLQWDLLNLWSQICHGLRAAGSKYGRQIKSIGVDTWGVDYALLGRNDTLLANPVSYRDRRTDGVMERVFGRVPRDEIFAETGLQFMGINTLYQLVAMRWQKSPVLDVAESFLMMPDLFHWLLTGVKSNEYTNATTTQFFNPSRGFWATTLLEKLELPTNIFCPIVQPGTRLGRLRPEVAVETGLSDVDVVVVGTHDTASAVMAVPAGAAGGPRPDWCYISSGTWSLMGVEMPRPVVNDKCRQWNFTNEGGVGSTTRLLKNITGLWLVQECRRIWSQSGRAYRWDELVRLAEAEPALASLVNPDDPAFQSPGNMPEAIRANCQQHGQPVPASDGALIRCVLESLALKCRYVLGALEDLVEGPLRTIHVVGGGVQNRQLCQATADACQRRVLAGPIEATALGNVMMQSIAAGSVGSIADARAIIARSFPVETYEPRDHDLWSAAYERFRKLLP